jgi:hypothetical protein
MALKFSFGRRNFIEKLSKVVRFFSENYFWFWAQTLSAFC